MIARAALLLSTLIICALSARAGESSENKPAPLSVRSYWRHHLSFGPAECMKKDGSFFQTGMRFACRNGGRSYNRLTTGGPPKGWTQPEFDDSRWPVQRVPFSFMPEMRIEEDTGVWTCFVVRRMCSRARFVVPDPARAGNLKLAMTYGGGVIVSLNGKELARANIAKPGSPAAKGGYAQPYPEEAYWPRKGTEPREAVRKMTHHGMWAYLSVRGSWRWRGKPYQKQAQALSDRIRKLQEHSLSVNIPRELLRRGVNVLTVENLASPLIANPKGHASYSLFHLFPHMGVAGISLNSGEGKSPPAGVLPDVRPAGANVWVEDPNRWMLAEDFLEPGVKQQRTMRLLAPRGSSASGQVIIGTSAALGRPSATLKGLTGPGGATIPASAVKLRWARPSSLKLVKKTHRGVFRTMMLDTWMMRYRGGYFCLHSSYGKRQARHRWPREKDMLLFDQLSASAPASIPAGSSQPIWVTVNVPRDAKPGLYQGKLVINAGKKYNVDVSFMVFGWRAPAPRDYVGYVGVDQSPWAVAKWGKAKLWSVAHWKLIEASIRNAGLLGSRVISVPVIQNTELRNGSETMIPWTRKGTHSTGSGQAVYEYDFSILDKYLALWRKHCHSKSDIVLYITLPANNYGRGGGAGTVNLRGGGTAKITDSNTWAAFCQAARKHLNARGFKDGQIHWGLFYDYAAKDTKALAGKLKAVLPGVGWARSSHGGNGRNAFKSNEGIINWDAAVRRYCRAPFGGRKGYEVVMRSGWKDQNASLLLPRSDSDVTAMGLCPPLWQLRSLQEMAITSSYRGFARLCVDGWNTGGYFGPYIVYMSHPDGKGGMDSSVQLEVLREGLVEAEARISLEKRGSMPAEVRKLLDRRTERLWVLPPRPIGQRLSEYHAGWQESAWDLYAAASKAAGSPAPSNADKQSFFDSR
jgi:Glycoside hydrolase 123, catalytic domain/Glycoside hydrolase 123 N-terminal domain